MHSNNMYKTKQKQLILECLKCNAENHMTADEIYFKLLENGNKVGIATIYRNLSSLTEEGKVKRFDIMPTACYQYIDGEQCKNHYHLKCVKCDKLYHVESPELDKLNKLIGDANEFCIDNQKIILYGKCKEC